MESRSNPQPLRSARHSGVIDRRDVDPMLAQRQIARRLALLWVPDQNRHDMRVARHQWQVRHIEHVFHPYSSFLMSLAFPVRSFEVTDCGGGGGANRRRQGTREDETWCIRPHGVN